MKAFTVLAVVGLVAAQNIGDLSKCAQDCVNKQTSSTAIGGCSPLDIACICKNESFLDNIACCLSDNCSAEDQKAAVGYAKTVCTTAKVTVPDQVVCKNANSSTTPTSTTTSTTATPNAAWSAKTAGPVAAVGGVLAALALL